MAKTALKIEEFELISIREIAKRCKINERTCGSRLEELGYIPEVEKATLKLYRFDDEMEFAVKSAKDSASAAKLRDLRATYELKELKLAEARKELVSMAETVEIAQRLTSAIYQEFAVRQPKRIAAALAKAKNVIAVKSTLKKDTDRIMKSLLVNFDEFIK